MITAIDANIVLDLLAGSSKDTQIAYSALSAAKAQGGLVISAVSYAEVAGRFKTKTEADGFFSLMSCRVDPMDEAAAFLAGQFFRDYKLRGGKRDRILADFLIGAHALIHADRILSRDDRFFRGTFPKLKAVRPADLD